MVTAQPISRNDGDAFAFDASHLCSLAAARRADYAAAEPFPHVVLDEFLPNGVAERLLDEFPDPRSFHSESSLSEPRRLGKRRSTSEDGFSPLLRSVLNAFCAADFLQFVSDLSGKPSLVSDDDRAGALRHYGRGARLGVHVDSNFNPRLNAFRRVNLIYYLNRDWADAYRGHLELWDARMSRCVKRIEPVFNRAILFDVNETAFHGFPDAIRCPRGMTRKTIQFYYYTHEAPDATIRPHGTLFRWRAADRWNPYRLWHALYGRVRRRSRRGRRPAHRA